MNVQSEVSSTLTEMIDCCGLTKPWSRRRLMFWRSWVQIPAPYTGWTFFTCICCKSFNDVSLKTSKINDKSGRGWPILEKVMWVFSELLYIITCLYTLGNIRSLKGTTQRNVHLGRYVLIYEAILQITHSSLLYVVGTYLDQCDQKKIAKCL